MRVNLHFLLRSQIKKMETDLVNHHQQLTHQSCTIYHPNNDMAYMSFPLS